MRFPAKKNAGRSKAPRHLTPKKDSILHPVGLSWNSPPPPPESVRTSVHWRHNQTFSDRLVTKWCSAGALERGPRYYVLRRCWGRHLEFFQTQKSSKRGENLKVLMLEMQNVT